MELDSNLKPWIQQLEAAVEPYLQFVDEVSAAIADLEPRVTEALRAQRVEAPLQAVLPSSDTQATTPMIIGIEPEKFQAL